MLPNVSNEYIAGFFDGEGTVSFDIWKAKRKFGFTMVPVIDMSQKTKEVLAKIQEALGFGELGLMFKNRPINSSGNVFVLKIQKEDIKKFIERVKPYSIVKKHQLELMEEAILLYDVSYRQAFGFPKEEFLKILNKAIEIRSLNTKHSRPIYDLNKVYEKISLFNEEKHRQKILDIHTNLGTIHNSNFLLKAR